MQTLKILSQNALAAITETDLYTVPTSTDTAISSVVICNRGATTTSFRLYVAAAGATTSNKMYLYYDLPLSPNNTFIATVGLTLATTDVLRGYAANGSVSMSAFGVENS